MYSEETSAPERIVYTDAAGKSKIAAAAVLTPGAFEASDALASIIASKAAKAWQKTFGETCYIYGLEMSEALAILMAKERWARWAGSYILYRQQRITGVDQELREPHRDSGNGPPHMAPGKRHLDRPAA